jgi:tetratricopeptide (TPR) repeat protein
MRIRRVLFQFSALSAALFLVAASAYAAAGGANGKKIEFTTKSKEAKDYVAQIVYRIETFQFGPQSFELAKKATEADPNFAFGYYLMGTASPTPQEGRPHIDKAIELAKNASEGERRYIEAVMLVRGQKYPEGIAIFNDLAKQFPGERMVQMMLGQAHMAAGNLDEARASLERAAQIDASTPRVHTFLGNVALLKGDYAKARELYKASWAKKAPKTAPFGPGYGLAYAHIYEGDMKSALKALEDFQVAYVNSDGAQQFPPVFIWNSIGRLLVENGRAEEAIKAYEKGYESVPGANMPENDKKAWLGRLHHGKGRAFAKMGKHAEAWKEAETIKKMIEDGGEAGKQFWPAYHYIAGYLKLESGDYAKAIEHLKQADLNDPFHKLLLARAYEKTGDQENAQKLYKEIVSFNIINIERALSYPEAKKKIKG